MLGIMDKWWSALIGLARLYALAMYCYLGAWGAYSAYTANDRAPAATEGADGVTEYAAPGMTAEIPIRLSAARAADYQGLILYYTRDAGKPWQSAATAMPTEQSFHFTAPEVGAYGFAAQAKLANGTMDPASTDDLRVAYRIRFGAQAPTSQKSTDPERDGNRATLRDRVDALEKRLEMAERQKASREAENNELRGRIERLEKRMAELEKDGPNGRD